MDMIFVLHLFFWFSFWCKIFKQHILFVKGVQMS